ncbi:MAG TPA: 2,3-bisphosphoglycerate-independent phosphoglycerate mutase [Firmicutes bacterium]|nr:2,3-bisphosphoglycerate-independent phosphoglycerate mutase [Bacillota bacterium]
MDKKPLVMIILDGFGIGMPDEHNAIHVANTPELDKLMASCPNTIIAASGEDVGLPVGQVGNSEVGHMNIGAGRVIYQDLSVIMDQISDGRFYANKTYNDVLDYCSDNDVRLHLMGLLSDGGVHSHIDILYALMEMAKKHELSRVFIHAFLDGRDVGPTTGLDYVRSCVEKCAELDIGKIATVMGRFYSMDRDRRWARLERAYRALVLGDGRFEDDPVNAISHKYETGSTDEFIRPIICDRDGMIRPNDAVIFFNFRPDRAREITSAFTEPGFSGFVRPIGLFPLYYVCTTQYDERFKNVRVAFPPKVIKNTFGEYISKQGLTQLRLAETEKYAHVTFFMDGGIDGGFPGETQVLVPSPKNYPTYDLIPEMSAYKVADEAVKYIKAGKHDVIIMNFANCDMVGHTGDMNAAVKATEVVDACVHKVVEAVSEKGGMSLILADHGNADKMYHTVDDTPHTAHTRNPVPFIVVGANVKLRPGRLADIAPTALELMGLEKPVEMTGNSLIVH